MIHWMTVLAQAAESAPAERGGPPLWYQLMPFILLLVILYFFLIRGRQKEQKKRREMLAAVKKNDRVMTIGGIVGTVVNVRDEEVVLKVDEAANVKLTFTRGSIQRVLSEEGSS
jgi:preprotein translocase subunit YajC